MKPKIVVIGSVNMDMIIRTAHLPKAGETVLGEQFIQSLGGKGANQAVAAARLGAEVTLVARLGKDRIGAEALAAFEKEGIHTRYVAWDDEAPSGVAMIMINMEGEDIICVAPGANRNLSIEDVRKAEGAIREADCVLLQLEIPLKSVEYAVQLASKYHVRVVLNPAPMMVLPKEMLKKVDVFTPNETEAAALTGNHDFTYGDLATHINRKYGIKNVIVTLGKGGALLSRLTNPRQIEVPAFPVNSVDSTGAGDAFNGALAVMLARGEEIEDAVRYANAVGALATTREGAQSSLPTASEVDSFLERIAIHFEGYRVEEPSEARNNLE